MNTFHRKALATLAAVAALMLAGCASSETKRAEADAQASLVNLRSLEATARIREAEAEKELASKLDAGGAAAAYMAKYLRGAPAPQTVQVQQPQSVLGLAWQTVLQIADLGLRGYGIKAQRDVGIVTSNNNRDISLSTNATFGQLGQSIAAAGVAGYRYVQAPQPNVTNTLSGPGVIGSGTYTGPVTTTTTRNCSGGTGAAGGAGGGAAAGTDTAPGGPGGNGAAGGGAPGGSC